MNFRDLNYFVALAKLKNYTAAAQQFHVSQPTITYAIKRLKKNYKLVCFNEINHTARLS